MTLVHKIEPNPPPKPTNVGGRHGRAGSGATIQPVEAPGRALATQRDALFFRSEALLRLGAPAQAPFLAQQIGQLWPTTPPANHKTAMDAYQKNSPTYEGFDTRSGSVLA